MNNLMTIPVQFRVVKTSKGTFNILESSYWGWKMSISSDIKAEKQPDGVYTITYDPNKTYMFANEQGYITLKIMK